MAGDVSTMSDALAVTRCAAEPVILDPRLDNVRSSDISSPSNNLPAPRDTLDGPCGAVSACDEGLLPPSCVVEDDVPLPSPRRHHHHHYRRYRSSTRHHHRFCRVKWKEVNFMAAMLNIVAAVLVCTSLAEPRWWYISGSPCMNSDQRISYLGVKQFFYKGFFVDRSSSNAEQISKYYYGTLQTEVLVNCVTPQTVYVIKAIIALCFVAVALCLMAILLDVVVFSNRCIKAIRHHAILSILAVFTCIIINCLSYIVTRHLVEFYETHKSVDIKRLDVEFSFCFYIIMSAGVMGVFSVAFSLLCRRSCHAGRAWCRPESVAEQVGGRRRRNERLIDADYNQMCSSAGTAAPVSSLPPPYTP